MGAEGAAYDRGFTVTELLVSLLLLGVVATSVIRVTLRVLRHERGQTARVQVDADLRLAAAFLEREFRPLAAAGTGGSDIVESTDSSIQYRSMRGLFLLCSPLDAAARRVVLRRVVRELPPLDPVRDSLLLFVDGDGAGTNSAWLRAGIVDVQPGASCADGAAGTAVAIRAAAPARLRLARVGAPARGFEVVSLSLYRDARGDRWLGEQRWNRVSGWSARQPIAGRLARRGFRLTYRDRAGQPTTNRSAVARIDVTLTGAADPSVATAPPGASRVQALTVGVALRNNPRP